MGIAFHYDFIGVCAKNDGFSALNNVYCNVQIINYIIDIDLQYNIMFWFNTVIWFYLFLFLFVLYKCYD